LEHLQQKRRRRRRKKKTIIVVAVGVRVLVAGYDGQPCLWLPKYYVVAGEVAATLEKKKKIWLFHDCVVGMTICGHRLSLLFLFLEWQVLATLRQRSG
jgi:hypothetical protein